MRRFIDRLDRLAGIEATGLARWLERGSFVFLVLMTAFAPHSIAASQTAWIAGSLFLIAGLVLKPRIAFRFGPLDAALWGFFAWSVVTSLTSYAPDISIDKLRGTAVFLVFYLAILNIRSRRSAAFLLFVLIGSTAISAFWMPVERLIGRGVEVHGLDPAGPLAKALLWDGDTLLQADGEKLRTPEDVVRAIEARPETAVKFYRPDFEFTVRVHRADLLTGTSAAERLGIAGWKKSRNWRSAGFLGHYTTYAEILQLVGSLAFGVLAATIAAGQRRKWAMVLAIAFAGLMLALLLTVTRAPQLAMLVSAGFVAVLALGRRWLIRAALIGIPVALAGLFMLQQSRQVGFFDSQDDSIRWRQVVWREGAGLWSSSPRNILLGVGMDSIKRYEAEWHLFDNGRLNMGHFHSTPLNLLVERGLPALLLWLTVLAIYARTLWRGLRQTPREQTLPRGIILGCLGGMIGFTLSGLVHYNLGDQEVVMVFFLLMGIGVSLAGQAPAARSVDSSGV
jgi:hypothetical protein